MFNKKQQDYPRVTSFDVIKQSTDICAHQITFSSIFFCLKYRCQQVYVCRHYYFDRQQFRRLSLAVEENDFFTVAQCSQGVLCIVQERPKITKI